MSAKFQWQTLRRPNLSNAIIALCSAKICIAQAIDLYSGKSRGQREQHDGLQLNAALRVAS